VVTDGLPLIVAVLGTELVAKREEEMRDGRNVEEEGHERDVAGRNADAGVSVGDVDAKSK
jgi:hypothetical protein